MNAVTPVTSVDILMNLYKQYSHTQYSFNTLAWCKKSSLSTPLQRKRVFFGEGFA